MKRLLVTGAAGFIGKAIVNAAASYGWEAHGVSRSREDATGSTMFHVCDVRDELGMTDIFRAVRPDAVSHHAGLSDLFAGQCEPTHMLSSNVIGTSVVFELARECDAHFLLASTRTVTGDLRRNANGFRNCPRSVYAASKLMCEHLLKTSSGGPFRSTIVRYPSIYGPGQTRGLIGSMARHLLLGRSAALPGAHFQQEYVYIDDVVRAHFLVLGMQESVCRVWEVGHNPVQAVELLVVWELLRTSVGRYLSKDWSIHWDAAEVYDTEHLRSAEQGLFRHGWQPQMPLQEGIDKTVDWVVGEMKRNNEWPVL